LKTVGAVPPVKLNDGRVLGSKAIAGEGEGALKLKPLGCAAAGCTMLAPKLKPPELGAGAEAPKLNPVEGAGAFGRKLDPA